MAPGSMRRGTWWVRSTTSATVRFPWGGRHDPSRTARALTLVTTPRAGHGWCGDRGEVPIGVAALGSAGAPRARLVVHLVDERTEDPVPSLPVAIGLRAAVLPPLPAGVHELHDRAARWGGGERHLEVGRPVRPPPPAARDRQQA